jgi:ABC-type antimicrobial peptide transport system permease subunit
MTSAASHPVATPARAFLARRVSHQPASGLALGVPLVFVSTAMYRTFLFGVTAMEPAVVSAAAVGVVLLAVAAGYISARGAGRLDPLAALRDE